MSTTPQVVDGEASESDTEIEIGATPDAENPQRSPNPQASVISGEASESDDEDRLSPPAQPTAPPAPQPVSPTLNMYSNSILHHRLWEVNVSMRRNVEVLGLHTMKLAYEKMSSLNRELLALQESVRFADSQVTLARARSRQVKEQLKNCHFQTALPTLKIEQHS